MNRMNSRIVVRILSLIAVLSFIITIYIIINRPISFDHDYPILVIESTGDPSRMPLYKAEDPVLKVMGNFQDQGDARMPTWGDEFINIVIEIDGRIYQQTWISVDQTHFEDNVNLSRLPDGVHTMEVYAEHRADWRTWRSNTEEFEFGFNVSGVEPPKILSLSLVKEPDMYLITGMVGPDTDVQFEGAELGEGLGPMLFQRSFSADMDAASTFTISSDPSSGIFWAYFKPDEDEPVVINSINENANLESDSPIVIAPGTIEKFASTLIPMETNLQIMIDSDGIRKEFSARTLPEHPLFTTLLEDKTKLRSFVQAALGNVTINEYEVASSFERLLPGVWIEDGVATIHTASNSRLSGELRPLGMTTLNIQPNSSYIPFNAVGTLRNVQITIQDYQVRSVSPAPYSIDGDTYTWKGIQPGNGVQLNLERALTAQLGSLSRWPIYAFVGNNYLLSNIVNFSIDLLIGLLFIGLIWLNANIEAHQPVMQKLQLRISSALTNASALFFLPPFFYLISSITSFFQPTDPESWSFWQYLFDNEIFGDTFNRFATFESITILLELGILFSVLLLIFYVGWLFKPQNPFARFVIALLSRIFLYLILIEASSLVLISTLTERDEPTILNYLVWLIAAAILTLIGFGLLTNMIWLIRFYAVERKDSILRRAVTFIALLIPIVAFGITYRPAIDQEYYSFSYRYDIIYNLQILGDAAIYFSGFSAVMIAFLLESSSRWKWEPGDSGAKTELLKLTEPKWYQRERYWYLLGVVMFAGYLVGVSKTILSIPLSAIIAAFIFKFLLIPPVKVGQLAFYIERIFKERKQLLDQLAMELAVSNLKKKLEQLLVNLSAGKMNPSDYDKAAEIIHKEIEHLESERPIKDIPANEFALAVGPYKKSTENALFGAKWAFILQLLPLFVLFNSAVLDRDIYPWLYLTISVFIFIMRWILLGVFFGLFYEYLKGKNGIRKALTVTLGILAATLPYRLLRSSWDVSTTQAFILELSLTMAFVLALGILFDRKTLEIHGFNTSYLKVITSDFTSLAYVSSLLLPVVTVIIPTLISGQFGEILTTIVKDILPAIAAIPPIQ